MGHLTQLCAKESLESQASDLWTGAATVVKAVREEKSSEETRLSKVCENVEKS